MSLTLVPTQVGTAVGRSFLVSCNELGSRAINKLLQRTIWYPSLPRPGRPDAPELHVPPIDAYMCLSVLRVPSAPRGIHRLYFPIILTLAPGSTISTSQLPDFADREHIRGQGRAAGVAKLNEV